eukprot:13790342-Heterocapsa_arctica.AAC.1
MIAIVRSRSPVTDAKQRAHVMRVDSNHQTTDALLKHFSNTFEALVKHFSSTSQSRFKHYGSAFETLVKHLSSTIE